MVSVLSVELLEVSEDEISLQKFFLSKFYSRCTFKLVTEIYIKVPTLQKIKTEGFRLWSLSFL